jgi:DNA-3-methyladenine glycosylase II
MRGLILPRAPFNLAITAQFLKFNEAELVDTFENNQYARALRIDKRLYLLSAENTGTSSRPSLNIDLKHNRYEPSKQHIDQAISVVQHMFSTEHNLKDFRKRIKEDQVMLNLEASFRGLHLPCLPSLFETLATSILLQQISTPVARILKNRMVETFGERLNINNRTYFAFPRPEELAQANVNDLRLIGLSSAKAASIINAAEHISSGMINERELIHQDNDYIISRLTTLRGIGRWTAEWALILFFGRTNVFPAGDLALRNFITKFYSNSNTLSEREVRIIAHNLWGEWSSYAVIYFFAGLRSGTIPSAMG